MQAFKLTLRVLAAVILVIASLHALLGHGAETLLGVPVPLASAADPSQDSQNRFFGMAFAIYAAVLLLASGDPTRYEHVFRFALLAFFAGGVARLVSIATHGLPAPAIIGLAVVELVAPPVLFVWFRRIQSAA